MKQLFFFSFLIVFANHLEAQYVHQHTVSSTFTIDTLFTNVNSKDDLINITVSNPTEKDRQFIVEIIAIEPENSYWGTIYSAAINEDSYFFKQWREGKKIAEKLNVSFALPRYNKLYQSIEADEAKDLSLKIVGKPLQTGMPVQLRITVLDNNEVAYSPVFNLYKQPY